MSGDVIVLLNSSLYTSLFIYNVCKYRFGNISTFLSLLYCISSLVAILLYNFPLYNMTYTSHEDPSFVGCIYLFILNFLLIQAFSSCNVCMCKKLKYYDEKMINYIQIFLISLLLILAVCSLPFSIDKYLHGKDLADMRDEVYGDNSSNSIFFLAIISRFFGALPIFLISVSCIKFFLSRKINYIDALSFLTYGLLKLNTVLSVVSRAVIVFSSLEIFIILILFYPRLTKEIKHNIMKIAAAIIPFMMIFFTMVSNARFSKNIDSDYETLATLRYIGEPQLNFMNLMYDHVPKTFGGFSQFPLFRRALGMTYDDGLGRENEDVFNQYIINNYGYEHPTYIFYTLVGTLYSNWGMFAALMICILIYAGIHRIYKKPEELSFMGMVLTIIIAAYVGKGLFYGDYQNESGNFLILFLVLLTIYLYVNGKNKKIKMEPSKSQLKNIIKLLVIKQKANPK